jgi:uncharacterized protein
VHIPRQRPAAAAALERLVCGQPWMLSVLVAVRACGAPDCWVGGGVLRDLVWDQPHGGFDPARVKDVDVAFYDPDDLTPKADQAVEAALRRLAPQVPWDAKNQASVHLWYEQRFGYPVAPLRSAADGVATWPETATAVAVRLDDHDQLQITAAGGLEDLLQGVCRRNPRRVSVAWYRHRVQAKQVATRWPKVQIHW